MPRLPRLLELDVEVLAQAVFELGVGGDTVDSDVPVVVSDDIGKTTTRVASRAGGGATGRNRRSKAAKEPWDTLEVTGSLVLAALLLMSLFLGGRASPSSP